MALILEIRDARGVATLHRLDTLPVTIGRALSNDIILDDPFADARHASIGIDESGVMTIGDLGSLNGLRRNGTRESGSVAVEAGTEIRLGHTTLRFRDVDEVVAPALADDDTPKTAPALVIPALPRRSRLLGTISGRLGIATTMVSAFALSAWLSSTARSNAATVFGATIAVTAATLVWASLWTMTGRAPDRRSAFLSHFAFASLALLVLLLWGHVNDWLTFLFPDAPVVPTLFLAVFLTVLAALVAAHLGVSGSMPRRARWRAGLITSAVVVALFFFIGVVTDDKFSDVPKFASAVRPLPAQLIPTKSVTAFGADMRELKDDVDEALEKQADRDPPASP